MKKLNESNFVTELRIGETIECDGPAKFTILETLSSNHKNRCLVSVVASRSVRIKKLVVEAKKKMEEWEL